MELEEAVHQALKVEDDHSGAGPDEINKEFLKASLQLQLRALIIDLSLDYIVAISIFKFLCYRFVVSEHI